MIKLTDLLKEITEGKQVGNLYHFTYDTAILKILKNGLRFSPDNTELDKHKNRFYISTTRDHTGRKFYKDMEMVARVTLDGNKISEHYSIEPINVENIWNTVWGFGLKRSSAIFFTPFNRFSYFIFRDYSIYFDYIFWIKISSF